MTKRSLILFSIICSALCLLSLQIISINGGKYAKTASYSNSKVLSIAKSRGTVYDCEMRPLLNAEETYAVAIKPTFEALASVTPYVGSERLAIIKETLGKGSPSLLYLSQRVDGGKDIKVIPYKRRYSSKQYATHLLGYIDADGVGVSGIEKGFNDYLSEVGGELKAAFYVDALGRNLGGADIDILDEGYDTTRGIVLTIDFDVQKALEDSLDKYGWESGAAVAIDPKTGAIRGMASRPNFNPNKVSDSLNTDNSPLLNKALIPYSVGSTFKVIVSAAALEQNSEYEQFTHDCTGVTNCSGTEFGCFERTAHGKLNMEGALIHSCNTYFIALAQSLGASPIVSTAASLGFGVPLTPAAGIASKSGALPSVEELDSVASLANLAFGQGKLSASPLQLAAAFAVVADGGTYKTPYLLEGYLDSKSNFTQSAAKRSAINKKKRVLTPYTASRLTEMMTKVVDENKKAKPTSVSAAGKTATAQSGQYKNGEEVCHTWFAGWYPATNPELVIVIMKESGLTGISDCGPVFKNIVDSLTINPNIE